MKFSKYLIEIFTLAVMISALFVFAAKAMPANDDLANAETLATASGAVNRNNVDATRQTGEPLHNLLPMTLAYRTVWFQWTATETKPVVFEITSADFDATIAVYVGNSFPFSEETTLNNDTFGNRPRVEFGAVSGTTYKIAVGLYNNPSLQGGNFALQWAVNNAPTNDNFANALTFVNVPSGNISLTKRGATKEVGEPVHIAGNKSVWYSFTNNLSTDYSISFSTLGSNFFDTTISVYTGSAVNSLTPVVKNDNLPASTQARVSFLAKSGVTYRIAVDEGFAINSGNSFLNWEITKIKRYTDFASKNNTTGEVFYDNAADISVFRPSDGFWYWLNSENNTFNTFQFGLSGDTPVPSDYDGDGISDFAVTRNSGGAKIWYIRNSFEATYTIIQWGIAEDKPVPGDYDADGRTDLAVFRPSTNIWYIRRSSDGQFFIKQFGLAGDIPVLGDFKNTPDGSDLAVFRPSNGTWYIFNGVNTIFTPFGLNGDKPVPADYGTDGKTDIAVFRPSEGNWYVLQSNSNQLQIVKWGVSGDIPMTGDYDNNSNDLEDFAVFRPSNQTWYILKSQGFVIAYTQFGLSSDILVSSLANLNP